VTRATSQRLGCGFVVARMWRSTSRVSARRRVVVNNYRLSSIVYQYFIASQLFLRHCTVMVA